MKVLYMTGNAIDTDMLHQLDVAINPLPPRNRGEASSILG